MKRTQISLSVLALVMLTGCAASRNDLVQTGYLTLQPTLTASLSHAPTVSERDGNLVVEGRLDAEEAPLGGHVDVQVVAPDGTVAYSAKVSYKRASPPLAITSRAGLKGARTTGDEHATYSVTFPGLPPQGSIVTVRCDLGEHGGK